MKQELFEKAKQLQDRIKNLERVKIIIENKDKKFEPSIGIAMEKYASYHYSIYDEPQLTIQVLELVKSYCTKTIIELRKELDNL